MSFNVELDLERGIPIYRQIYEQVVRGLASGALALDEQLPTIHELARALGVNPNTVARSYRDLERDGHIVGHRGKGTFPARRPPAPQEAQRETLHDIATRALDAAARHKISPKKLLQQLRSMIDE